MKRRILNSRSVTVRVSKSEWYTISEALGILCASECRTEGSALYKKDLKLMRAWDRLFDKGVKRGAH